MKDYYQILGVEPNATLVEIKRAYRKLALRYHPDQNSGADAHDRFVEISEAYSVLGNVDKKWTYDQRLQFAASVHYRQASPQYKPPPQPRHQPHPPPPPGNYYKRGTHQKTPKSEVYSIRNLKTARWVSLLTLLLAFSVFADYLLPKRVLEPPFKLYSGREIHLVKASEGFRFPITPMVSMLHLRNAETIHAEITMLYGSNHRVIFTYQNTIYEVRPYYGLYSTFIFLPVILLVFSLLGLFYEKKRESVVGMAFANIILSALLLVILISL